MIAAGSEGYVGINDGGPGGDSGDFSMVVAAMPLQHSECQTSLPRPTSRWTSGRTRARVRSLVRTSKPLHRTFIQLRDALKSLPMVTDQPNQCCCHNHLDIIQTHEVRKRQRAVRSQTGHAGSRLLLVTRWPCIPYCTRHAHGRRVMAAMRAALAAEMVGDGDGGDVGDSSCSDMTGADRMAVRERSAVL